MKPFSENRKTGVLQWGSPDEICGVAQKHVKNAVYTYYTPLNLPFLDMLNQKAKMKTGGMGNGRVRWIPRAWWTARIVYKSSSRPMRN